MVSEFSPIYSTPLCINVLILVLVEDGLRGDIMFATDKGELRLNPCSCGGWSQRTNWTGLLTTKEQS